MSRLPTLALAVAVSVIPLGTAAASAVALVDPPVPTQAPPAQPQTDPFGEEITLQPRTVIYMAGSGKWDSAFDTLVDAFKSVRGYLEARGIKADGPPMTIFTETDDDGFSFRAAIPVAAVPTDPPRGAIAVGQSPGGRALRFTHRGPYEGMDQAYEAIANYLDGKQLDAREVFLEEYVTDPVTTAPGQMVVHVIVPVK